MNFRVVVREFTIPPRETDISMIKGTFLLLRVPDFPAY